MLSVALLAESPELWPLAGEKTSTNAPTASTTAANTIRARPIRIRTSTPRG